MGGFETLDLVVIVLYFVVLLGIVVWTILQKQSDTEDYFLAGRNIGWFIVGASIFASNIGSEHIVGLAGTGASDKMPLLIFELHAWIVLILGWVFLPFYSRSGVFTMPEFLERRFNAQARWFLSIFSLVGYVLTKVSVSIYAGGVVISSLFEIDFWTGALLTVVLTGAYTVLGGMRAVVYTEALQAVILVIGATVLTIMGLQEVGGWSNLKAAVGESHFDMWRPADDPEFPWPSLLFGSTIVGIWYWCTDQYIVQRALTAKNITEGRRGTIWGSFLKLLPVFIFLIPGVVALALSNMGKLELGSSDQAFPVLMRQLLPAGLRGLVAAGLLAALMSSLASVFNSCSTLFTVDIYKKLRPDTPEKNLVQIGRIATGIVVILGIAWIPLMDGVSSVLYEYLQSVQSYIAPPITAVFLLGIFSKRINSKGAMATLLGGLLIGATRLILELNKDSLSGFLYAFADMSFLTFAVYMFVFCVVLTVVVSLATEKPSEEQLVGLTFGTLTEAQKASNRASYNKWDIIFTLIILVIVIGVMASFTG
ncbi:MAG: sodium:solute symporter [Bacteroidota bacterium]